MTYLQTGENVTISAIILCPCQFSKKKFYNIVPWCLNLALVQMKGSMSATNVEEDFLLRGSSRGISRLLTRNSGTNDENLSVIRVPTFSVTRLCNFWMFSMVIWYPSSTDIGQLFRLFWKMQLWSFNYWAYFLGNYCIFWLLFISTSGNTANSVVNYSCILNYLFEV